MSSGIVPVGGGISVAYNYEIPDGYKDKPPSTRKAPIVLIGGFVDIKESWMLQTGAFLKTGHPVLTFDNRGCGASSRPDGPYTTELMAGDIKALVRHLKIPTPFHILGTSMGGMIAQSFAIANIDGRLGVVLVCTFAEPGTFCTRLLTTWTNTLKTAGTQALFSVLLLQTFTHNLFRPENEDVLREVERALSGIDMTVENCLSQLSAVEKFDTTQTAGQLANLPVLVLASEEDAIVPGFTTQQLSSLIKSSECRITKGGHCCMVEYPEEFNTVVLEFLHKVESDRRNVTGNVHMHLELRE